MKSCLLIGLMVALAAPVALAADEELVDNPAYKNWSAYKAGAMTKLATTSDMEMNGQKMTNKSTMTQTLKEITPEKAVVEIVMEVTVQGNTMKMPAQTQEIKAKVPKDQVTPHPQGVTVTKKGEGDEEITVGDKKYKCHWQEYEMKGEAGGETKQDMSGTTKVWTCPDVVGGVVKMQMNMDKPQKTTTTTEMVENKAA